jgi:RNA polymerase sigma-70 factor (ECF subfamily)
MPPWPLGFRGQAAAERLLSVVVFRGGTRRFRLVRVQANAQPAFACYATDGADTVATGQGMIVLTLAGDRIGGVTRFLDNSLLPRFNVPATLPGQP